MPAAAPLAAITPYSSRTTLNAHLEGPPLLSLDEHRLGAPPEFEVDATVRAVPAD